MKAFVIAYNRLSLVRNMAENLAAAGLEVSIIDNKSDYPPLLEWYKECPYSVIKMDKNFGHTVFWSEGLYKIVGPKERYIVTDPDLDISEVPKDFVEILNRGLDKYKFHKCGLSLRIDDLPNTSVGNSAKGWESRFWNHKMDDMYYAADIDTTLAMYRENVIYHTLNAIRTEIPYCARHIPWYYTGYDDLPEDEKYYYSSSKSYTYWSKYMNPS